MSEVDEFAWLEPMRKRTQELQEETHRIQEESKKIWAELAEKRALSALDKLYDENDYGMQVLADKAQLSIEDIEDIYSVFVFAFFEENKGLKKFMKNKVSSLGVDLDRLIEKLETVINAQ